MGRREDVDNSLWSDPDFRELPAAARFLFIWGWTNPACNLAGVYRTGPVMMAEQTGLTRAQVDRGLADLIAAGDWTYERPWLWIRNRVRRLGCKNASVAKAVSRSIADLDPDHPMRIAFLEKYGQASWLKEALADLIAEPRRVEPKTDRVSTPCGQSQGTGTDVVVLPSSVPSSTRNARAVNRQRVTAEEWQMAEQIIAAFNEIAGSSFTLAAHYISVVGRIREHPELTAANHQAVIAAVFRSPWWKDRPAPQVIYGNAGQFERSLEQARRDRPPADKTDERLEEAMS